LITGGSFHRWFDLPLTQVGDTYVPTTGPDGGATNPTGPATVSSFRLDKFDVTVGRFRPFVAAWKAGYRPPPGSGRHTHLNGGKGLVGVGAPVNACATHEPGWVTGYDGHVRATDSSLLSCPAHSTWTTTPGENESRPINCISWWEAYAFCIWDGGFLPSDAEAKYAAAGGDELRLYPWGSTDPGSANQFAIYRFVVPGKGATGCYYPNGLSCEGALNFAPVGTAALGVGRWGHFDLVGNVSTWDLDTSNLQDSLEPCVDCASFAPLTYRVVHGSYYMTLPELLSITTHVIPPGGAPTGVRCARAP
jgi:formylglycine-generating enzyme required for sulfatase activity